MVKLPNQGNTTDSISYRKLIKLIILPIQHCLLSRLYCDLLGFIAEILMAQSTLQHIIIMFPEKELNVSNSFVPVKTFITHQFY